ncbi:MAG: hypothetical protein ABI632_12525 [Pseudolysinimonas sp.]
MDDLPSIDELRLSRELRSVGRDDRVLRRSAHRGELVQLSRGVYTPRATWDLRDAGLRYQLKSIGAVTGSRTAPILSHGSAAALLGIPRSGAPPQKVHVLATVASGSRTEGEFARHATEHLDFDIESLGQARRTGLRRTLVEYCLVESFANAVVALDWALATPRDSARPRADRASLLDCADQLGINRGRTRLLRALAFADPASESAGESFSRAVIHELGFPAPELQFDFDDRMGHVGRVDFWWPEQQLIGEFDGVAKYVREEFTQGVPIQQIVIAEKRREDRLRALGPRVTRWDAATVSNSPLFYLRLSQAGLHSKRRRRFV